MNSIFAIDQLIKKIQTLIESAYQGDWVDPEWDFTQTQELSSDQRDQANPTLYVKTGRFMHTARVHKPFQIIIFLDLNTNMHSWLDKQGWLSFLSELTKRLQGDILVEIRDHHDQRFSLEQLSSFADRDQYWSTRYFSHLSALLWLIKSYLDTHTLIVLVSDFLDLSADTKEIGWESFWSHPHLICLPVTLPSRWSNFHRYYLHNLPDFAQFPSFFQIDITL